MSANTEIGWTDHTWNPVRGCSRVSEGCRNCYAERQAVRNLPGSRSPSTGEAFATLTDAGPRWTGKVELIESKLTEPLHWKKPRRVFVNSMSDLFHEALYDSDIDRVFAVMALCPHITFQVLTKRAERLNRYWMNPADLRDRWFHMLLDSRIFPGDPRRAVLGNPSRAAVAEGIAKGWRPLQLKNVLLGVSVEDQATADERIPLLLQTPAALRFVSYEPALGPVDFRNYLPGPLNPDRSALKLYPSYLNWGIVGGESGPGARPCDLEWIETTVDQFRSAGVPLFVKQLGSRPVQAMAECDDGLLITHYPISDRKGANPREWPAKILVQEFPR